MCGRFTIGEVRELMTRFSVEHPLADLPHPRYNVAPAQKAPIIVGEPRKMVEMRWGLIPHWAKDEKIGSKMINARVETAAQKPAYRSAMHHCRCLVPATGFYEWKHEPSANVPYYIRRRDHELFAFAGLCEHWTNPHGEEVPTFTILTTRPNELVRPIHDRMPVILDRADEALWTGPHELSATEIQRLSEPYPGDEFEAYEVSTAVNDTSHDSERLIQPVIRAQRTLF